MSTTMRKCSCGTFLVGGLSQCPKCGSRAMDEHQREPGAMGPQTPQTVPLRIHPAAASPNALDAPRDARPMQEAPPVDSHRGTQSLAIVVLVSLLLVTGLGSVVLAGVFVYFTFQSADQAKALTEADHQESIGPISRRDEPSSPTEKQPTEKPPTEKPPTEKPPTEKPPTEKPPTEKPATEKPPPVDPMDLVRRVELAASQWMGLAKMKILERAYPTATLEGVESLGAAAQSNGTIVATFRIEYKSHKSFGGAKNHFEVRVIFDDQGRFLRYEYGAHTGLIAPEQSKEIVGKLLKDLLSNP